MKKTYTLTAEQYIVFLDKLGKHTDFCCLYHTDNPNQVSLHFLEQVIHLNFHDNNITLDDDTLSPQDKRQLHKKIRSLLKSIPTPNQTPSQSNHQTIAQAQISWVTDKDGNRVPISGQFDDVYFSHANGLAESRYVFIEQNHLPKRFLAVQQACRDGQNPPPFVIAETGFGTGLNFLATCLAWQQAYEKADWQINNEQTSTTPSSAILHFISTEKYPLSLQDLKTALATWQRHEPKLSAWINTLITHYPLAITGCHRRWFFVNGVRVLLDLWLGDAKTSFEQLVNYPSPNPPSLQQPLAKIDAWFLDGFAPSKNNSLWSQDLFDIIKQLSKPNTTLATFTAAGQVKRNLQNIGATVNKVKGFGYKREMICANFNQINSTSRSPIRPKTAIIVGAGISGLMIAYSLSLRGVVCTLIDKTAPLSGASGNPRALLSPKLGHISTADAHLPTTAHLYAYWFYQLLSQQYNKDIFTPTGVVDLFALNPKSHDQLSTLIDGYPNEFIQKIRSIDGKSMNALIKQAGLISPHQLAQTILNNPLINFFPMPVKKIRQNEHSVYIDGDTTKGKTTLTADIAIICAGFESHELGDVFNCRKIRGQVSWWHDNQAVKIFNQQLFTITQNSHQAHTIKYDGYACTFSDGNKPTLLCGASFVRNDTQNDIRPSEHQANQDKLTQHFPTLSLTTKIQGRASIRAQTPDYHPIIGQIDRHIYTMTGMGSKGFTFAPLCAEALASMICAEILPLPSVLLKKINPQRPRLQTPINQSD